MLYREEMTKPDGRSLTLYGNTPVRLVGPAPSPNREPLQANPHLRWHPLRGEWVAYASYRQGRTFMPPPEYNPLAPTRDPENPTELPQGEYQVAVFDNRFPSLSPAAHDPPPAGVKTAPARGKCEVVVFTKDPSASLAGLPLNHIELLMEVWGDRVALLGGDHCIKYVLPFENKGVEVGVTLHHPHGQIYAYPFVPPVPARMQAEELAHYREKGRPLLEELIEGEAASGERILYLGEHAVSFVPPCARYPYEVWVAPRRAVTGFDKLDPAVRADLARALKTTLLKYDGLWQRPFPYLMAWYGAPTDGHEHPECHLHAEFYPPYRSSDRLKYLAGTELAAGMFANDALPEEKARELRNVEVTL
ncbi:galactose-1-phosphate uridylyltransferase [Geomonas subterranea]|uniref:Galactose-1-phosphate uridylyltransferase n=1 Tax=Geomonas subterranea TaxID=2847989 RepID=A0ABX8LF71_9BACT|nr:MULTISPECIES: galactose-1-phosphate uridylyltransferase [Geomonas]QXE90094.1 galactose-1-phosphate uridylyltransferase [Geomonas subterranea]QXM07782.1 galactose-1-phosphate uridylyltransferase [Geomonas subterranea]